MSWNVDNSFVLDQNCLGLMIYNIYDKIPRTNLVDTEL